MKGLVGLKEKFKQVNQKDIFISEITLAELKFGFEKGIKTEKKKIVLEDFLTGVQVLPIYESIDFYATEKARLQKKGTPIDDFDLLIAATSITHNLIMVTNNTKHFKNVNNITLEDWTTATPA
jgi:tRNA(fMet)-specific endonuclease VapC